VKREQQAAERTRQIKAKARELGFSLCGVSEAGFLEEEAPRLEAWLNQGMHGKMAYMANWFDKRLDPRLLVPGARSVLSLMYNYHNPEVPQDPEAPRISQYAYGRDYHPVIRGLLRDLVAWIEREIGAVEGRVFVDSAPVLERAWARRSGLGWVGKNGNLIHPRAGSWYFLCELISDLDLQPDGPMKDYCGTCTACMDACPTDAIPQPYVVDGSRWNGKAA
jgi:epoxyqueuosine reductase